MAFIASEFTWVFAKSGMRTRIWQGPLVHGAPVQWLVFGNRGAPDVPLNFFVQVYSAAPPWYLANSGQGMVWNLIPGAVGRLSTGKAPWDAGFPLWLPGSPWLEVVVNPSRDCLAHLEVL